MELLAAALTGGNFSFEFDWHQHPGAKTPWTGQLIIVIDPRKSVGERFAQRAQTLVAHMHQAGLQRMPGERRYREREHCAQHGVAIAEQELAQLRAMADTIV